MATFIDAFAQGLDDMRVNNCNEASLRDVYAYCMERKVDNTSLKKYIEHKYADIDDLGRMFEDYITAIQYTSEMLEKLTPKDKEALETNMFKNLLPLDLEPETAGKMLCMEYKINVHIIDVINNDAYIIMGDEHGDVYETMYILKEKMNYKLITVNKI